MEKKKKRNKIMKKKCNNCNQELPITKFYKSNSPLSTDGKTNICKDCIEKMIDYNDVDNIKKVLQSLDLPYDEEVWKKSKKKNGEISIGIYIRKVAGLAQYKDRSFTDSLKEENNNDIKLNCSKILKRDLQELKKDFGVGYTDDEYILFNEKYNSVKNSFNLPTKMHEEYLREWCVDKVKGSLAKARGNFKEAKDWASMAEDVAKNGNLSPSQMNKSDLTGGLDSFSQMAKMVEQTKKGEMMSILPIFMEKPKDKVDETLFHMVNYVRDLCGKSRCEYRDIWKFIDYREEEYKKKNIDDLLKDGKIDVEKEIDRGIEKNLKLKKESKFNE